MSSENYTDQKLQQKLLKLDQIAPPGWDMEHSWEKLERIRGHKQIRLWGYLERIAATILLLAMLYGYLQQDSENEMKIIADTFEKIEDDHDGEPTNQTLAETVEIDENLDIHANDNQQLSPVLSLNKEQDILSDTIKEAEKENMDSVRKQELMAESMEIDNEQLIDSTLDISESENGQRLDAITTENENKRPPIIHFNRPDMPPSGVPNRKFKVRLKKLDRMITNKPYKKTKKYQYVGGINLRKP